ncbi:Methyltransferase [Lactiplantibacillus plantarum]|uniref:class I SAM-dependent DNA methyltransferase n=1 Tax=Lactiplantibacillus plantarum TaxID=1590 RepID=UPI0008637345|nr:class I SAM-dependent methyltransferase [Lactiplantibacillus plantarum]MBO2726846.1 methyltransferase domain-containing protein [Lactiplantibacillus plantarum]MCG0571319.1 Methyltransferase [Lactiplantibacillus plantarum]MCG0781726.1 Methyltransferase [Lactiplantibacillus plantarum]MCH8629413.1 class I SAM-dependent methyltransferase [Lactiplantibacillus plantarum]MCH8632953.1 class I SAM-dependent methyltransferase [Lactiplantibacillus plantarum]
MIYQTFAELYDELFDPAMYQQWLDFVRREYPNQDGQLLELACGSGRLGVLLAQAGYQVTGLDLSENMLALAQRHADEAAVTLPLLQGDMLDLSEIGTFDAVTCFADSFCYLSDITMVQHAFEQVAQHLTADGEFLFDVITPYQTDEVYPGYMYNYRDEDRAFMWTSYAGEQPHSAEHDLTFFIYNDDKQAFDEVSELHQEQTYVLADYQQALQAAGFNHVTVSADFGRQQPDDQTTRWFFKCRK